MDVVVRLPNGLELKGSAVQVSATAKALGYENVLGNDGVHYFSESKGPIRISEMDTRHIRNAILKRYREWTVALSSETDNVKLVNKLRNGPRDDVTLLALLTELKTRV